MKAPWILVLILLCLIPACSARLPSDAVAPATPGDLEVREASSNGGDVCWGTCDFVIARDGSEWEVIPKRSADATWGYHLNVVKLLEVSPGNNCINIWKIKLLPGGDLAVSISITHPYNDPCYTGFDVKGIIMFPASQYMIDPGLFECVFGEPYDGPWGYRFASYRKGDAELMNPDGHTMIWAPDKRSRQEYYFEIEDADLPILQYYPGRMASGEDIGTINGFKTYYTHKNRHMFQPGYTVTRTFIIRPPAEGPIHASYAVYAHWAPPSVYPVKNPAVDFPPEANSPIPYEFRIEQVGPIDSDAPFEVQAQSLLWHIKYWHWGPYSGAEDWMPGTWTDLLLGSNGGGIHLEEAFDICPDCYRTEQWFIACYDCYELPGTVPVVFFYSVRPPGWKSTQPILATANYIAWLHLEACDGEW
jgi:hypothetical protein